MAFDGELIQIVDRALAEANRKAAGWLVCRPGCFECCLGPFPISPRDAARLRQGLAELETADPGRAERIRERVARGMDGDDEPCPVLDPETGTCDLYAARPLTCRTFGPAIRWNGGAVGICELNFQGATEEEIAACVVEMDAEEPEEDEADLTTVAVALRA